MMTCGRGLCVSLVAFALVSLAASGASAAPKGPDPATPVVDSYKVTILSDSIPGRYTVGEWGFSALVEATSGGVTKRFLFDTSDKADTVIFNVSKLQAQLEPQPGAGFELCSVEDIVISHNNADHIGGLVKLRQRCRDHVNPAYRNGMSNAHVASEEIFWSRFTSPTDPKSTEKNPMVAQAQAFVSAGGRFSTEEMPAQFLLPGVFLTGRIQRTHDEKTYVAATPLFIEDPTTHQRTEDLVPEDQAIVINTASGTLVLTGCAHAGAANTMEQAIRMVGGEPTLILAGGLHLFQMEKGDRHTVGTLDWEAQRMTDLHVLGMLGGHCTGFERFFYVRDYVKLDWAHAAMAAVGTVLKPGPVFQFTSPQAVNVPMDTPKMPKP